VSPAVVAIDGPSRPVNRALVFAGCLMLADFLLAFPILSKGVPSWFSSLGCMSRVEAVLLAGVGAFLLIQEFLGRRGSVHPRLIASLAGLILVADFAILFGQVLGSARKGLAEQGGMSLFSVGNALEAFGWLSVEASLPAVWGSARFRRTVPEDDRAGRFARLAGGVLLFGMALDLAGRGFFWFAAIGQSISMGGGAFGILGGVLQFLALSLSAWAGIDSVRAAPSPDRGSRRARRVHRLVTFWMAAAILTTVCFSLSIEAMGATEGSPWYLVWRFIAYVAATTAVSVAVAELLRERSARLDGAPLKS
jgi:hypothetical protein